MSWKKELDYNDEVYWNDPNDGELSGYYKVVEVKAGGMLVIRDDNWNEVMVWDSEIS